MDLVSKPRGKSIVWMYFGLKADESGKPVTNDRAVCRLCRKVVISKGNTTNLRSHLRRRHPSEFFEGSPLGSSKLYPDTSGVDISHDELLEDPGVIQNPSNSSYVPDAVIPPGEPWLHNGPCRALLSLPSCLSVQASGEDQGEIKVFAKCQLQQGVMFGPFVGEACKGKMPTNLKYSWAVREDSGFYFVDATDENKSNWMRYVTYTCNEEKHNLVVFQFYRHIYYRVSMPITEGEELRVWIGQDYASLLGLGIGSTIKCEIGDKEEALRPLLDIQLVTLQEPGSASIRSESSQTQSPMPLITDVTTVAPPESTGDSNLLASYLSVSLNQKYDFLPGTEKLLSNPNAAPNSPWQFFGLEPDPMGRPLDRSTAVCKLCMDHVSCSTAADLQNHLSNKHHIKNRDLVKECNALTAAPPPVIPQFRPLNLPSPLPPAALESSKVTSAIVDFLIQDLQPPSLVEGQGFRQLLLTLLPPQRELPLTGQLKNLLREQYGRGRGSLALLLRQKTRSGNSSHLRGMTENDSGGGNKRGRWVTLSADVWMHSWQGHSEQMLTLWAHFLGEDFGVHNRVLGTCKLGGINLEEVEAQVRVMAQDWGISQPQLVVLGAEGGGLLPPIEEERASDPPGGSTHPNSTTFLERDDSAEDMRSQGGRFSDGFPLVPCFFSVVRGCVEEAMAHPICHRALTLFQSCVSALFLPPPHDGGSSHHRTKKLMVILGREERTQLEAWAHRRPPWNALYPLLSTFTKHRSLMSDLFRELGAEGLLVDAAATLSSLNSNSTPGTGPTLTSLRPEWKVLDELCLLLKPLDVACQTLARDAFPRLALVKPILTGLLTRHLASRPSDSSPSLKELKRMMRRKLASSYDSPALRRVLSVACALHPQFRGLGFMEDKEQEETFTWLKKEAVRIAKEDRPKPKARRSLSPESPESDVDLRRSKRLKECPPISFKDLADGEESDAEEEEWNGATELSPITDLASTPKSDCYIESEANPNSSPPAGLSGMEFLLGDLFSSAFGAKQSSVEESVNTEISMFRAEKGAGAGPGVEPLEWWRSRAAQFPLLAKVARAYLAAPAGAGDAAQDFVAGGGCSAKKKRSNIPPENLDAALFLHHNRASAGGVDEAGERGPSNSI